jgi:hypothetical protein
MLPREFLSIKHIVGSCAKLLGCGNTGVLLDRLIDLLALQPPEPGIG